MKFTREVEVEVGEEELLAEVQGMGPLTKVFFMRKLALSMSATDFEQLLDYFQNQRDKQITSACENFHGTLLRIEADHATT